MADQILRVKNLVKMYGGHRVVDNISFDIPKGHIIGLLGPNGAGKTTTIHILLGITLPDGGNIEYFGQNFYKHRESCLQRINFASAFNTLQGRITVWENLLVFAYLYEVTNPKKKILELIEYFEIPELLDLRYWDLSSGQRTRVNLIKSLLNDPEIILMDEPTAALDPDIADKTLSLIEQLRRDRKISILYTSHDMDEVTRICDEVIFLDHGRIVAQDTPLGLTKLVKNAGLKLTYDGARADVEKYLKGEGEIYRFPRDNVALVDTREERIPKLIFGLSKMGIWITDIEVKKPTLEDVFLQIARKEKDEYREN